MYISLVLISEKNVIISYMKDGFISVGAVSTELRVANTAFNRKKTLEHVKEAVKQGVKILTFSELSLTGYTSQDLFYQNKLQEEVVASLSFLAKETKNDDIAFIVGAPLVVRDKLYNTAVVINRGKILGVVPKTNIPNYQEFYERRWFAPAPKHESSIKLCGQEVPFGANLLFEVTTMPNAVFGVEICEDLWVASSPSVRLAKGGATIIFNQSCSDALVGKANYRRNLVSVQSGKLISAYIYCDASSSESSTDAVFSAHNLIAENGNLLAESRFVDDKLLISEVDVERLVHERMKASTFESLDEELTRIPVNLELRETKLTRTINPYPFVPQDKGLRDSRAEEIIHLQALGLKKRLLHTHAKCSVVGLSGGLDSTLALLVVVEAYKLIGKPFKDIVAITMPCFGTTKRTRSNAEILANALGVTFMEINIKESVITHFKDIGQPLDSYDVTYENGQARERTQVLMDVANKMGGLVIGTGDLSELALGWATYNGDHMSMYGVNASVPKTLVRHLVSYYAAKEGGEVEKVLLDILATPVSPELLPANEDGTIAQKTEDLVGPYDLHDFFIFYAVRYGFTPRKIFRMCKYAFNGEFSDEVIKRWLVNFYRRFFSQQFKRSCLPDGPKVGSVTFSPRTDWKMPSDAEGEIWIQEALNL